MIVYWSYVALAVLTFGVFHGATLVYFRRDAKATRLYLLLQVAIVLAAGLAIMQFCLASAEFHSGQIVGIAMLLGAVGIFWWTAASHSEDRPALVFFESAGSKVVTHGPYRFIRHPFYLSYVLGWASLFAFTLGWMHLGIVACMAAIYWYAARQEERVLLGSPVGAAYAEYRRGTGMFLPRLFARRRSPEIVSPVE